MIRRKLKHYLGEEHKLAIDIDKEILKKLKRIADRYSIQYALLWYIHVRSSAGFSEIYKVYKYLSDKLVRENTVRKQLQMLERKGLIKKQGNIYVTLVDPQEVMDLFDKERSRAGRVGATLRHLKVKEKALKTSPGLVYYAKKVVEEAQKLIRRGRGAVALDIITHTLLPIRENGILWLWHKDVFIYYEPKVKQFRAVRSEEIARLLRKLGFTEGIMILHVLGHSEASKIIKKIFSRGPYSWPWARSISYGLKELGLLQETTNFKIQLKRIDSRIELTLWDLYTKEILTQYTINWKYETPEPLKNRNYIVATVLGKQHVRKEIEEDSYFSKWKAY